MQCAVSRCQVTKRMRLDRGEIDVWARPSRAVPGLPGVLAAAAVLYSTVQSYAPAGEGLSAGRAVRGPAGLEPGAL